MERKKTAIIYARVSSATDRQSTTRQVEDLKRYAEAMGYEVADIFEEKVSGAKRNADREVLTASIDYSISNEIDIILCSELSRLGRNVYEVQETIKQLVDNRINLYLQKEQFSLLDDEMKPSLFAPIMLATLATCAQLERENIKFRLNSGRAKYIADGGKLGRTIGSTKSRERKGEEYKSVIRELKKGTSIRRTAKLCDVSPSTVQMVKREFGL